MKHGISKTTSIALISVNKKCLSASVSQILTTNENYINAIYILMNCYQLHLLT